MSANTTTTEFFRLDGKVAIITGAAGLLGKQHAIALSDFGANVILSDIKMDICEKLARQVNKRCQSKVNAIFCDVTKLSSWERLMDSVLSTFDKVDILVNNAAFTNQSRSDNFGSSFVEFPLVDWNQILNVNLTGTFLGCQVVGKHMLSRKSGSIINIASLYGVVSPNHRIYCDTGISQPAAYSISKSGVIALTRYLGTLWASKGVRVNCITPGGIWNNHIKLFSSRYAELSPIGRMAKSEEIRGALVYLASPASAYCTGHNIIVDGGWTAW
ncbi:MAG: SDR family oxidoreductase [Aliifodinibius sp.]|nr:SDR family oxidoreductase [Phycisphaerae bacterium]NIT62169.1 SDR family oxidoreductase [Fodinibius sp.]NIV16748.1 SDR family oxidoreductase [Fodinibius sp.]NIY30749.1 SDR family oxidoreductase [Fodinibius sp.]